MHGETINRVTDGKGLVKDLSLEQLRKFKVQTPNTKEHIEMVKEAGSEATR